MPELPEVEVTMRGISKVLIGHAIDHFVIRFSTLREPISEEFKTLTNLKVQRISRRGKYIIITTDKGSILIHLGMSGHLHVLPPNGPVIKHDHVDIVTDENKVVRLNDQRRFGLFLWFPNGQDPLKDPRLAKLGPEPLEESFNADVLYARLSRTKMPIKKALMDNEILVGVGNIYANEVLFACHISPFAKANEVTHDECNLLVENIKKILRASIKQGGTTIHDFSGSDGKPGYFFRDLKVYGKAGQACPVCGTTIESTVLNRSTFYCPKCQNCPGMSNNGK